MRKHAHAQVEIEMKQAEAALSIHEMIADMSTAIDPKIFYK